MNKGGFMVFLSNMGAIQKINALLKSVETKVTSIQNEAEALHPNVDKIKADAHIICILMEEVCEIADSTGDSVSSISYFFFGEQMKLREISMILAEFVKMCNDLYMESLKESLKCY